MVQIRQDIAQIQRNIDEQTVTNTRTVALIGLSHRREGEATARPRQIRVRTKRNHAYLDKLQAVYDETRAELSRLYRTNFPLSEELRTMSEELTREINRRTAEAIAEVDSARRP